MNHHFALIPEAHDNPDHGPVYYALCDCGWLSDDGRDSPLLAAKSYREHMRTAE